MKLQLTTTAKANQYVATNEKGHSTRFEYDDKINNKSVLSPLEALASSLGACMMVDIDSISKKQKQDIDLIQIDLDVDRQNVDQHTEFKSIHVTVRVLGNKISTKKLEKAIQLTTDTYCSVYKMLSKTISIQVDIDIIEQKESST